MKRTLSFLLVIVLILSLAACAPKAVDKTAVRVTALKGPTGMGMVGLMDSAEKGETANDYEFLDFASAPDELTGLIVGGNVDIAAVPSNLASVLYNRTEGGIKLIALNTLGVLYILEKGDSINSIDDLRGKTVYASGQGATPEYALNYILEQNGIDPENDVTIEYRAEHSELASLILAGEADIVLLPEPFVTNVTMKDESIRRAIDITAEWDAAAGGQSLLTMGCLVVSSEFAENNPAAVKTFLEEYAKSVAFVNSDTAAAAELIVKYEIAANVELAQKAIPGCNIVCITGTEMVEKADGFLKILFDYNPKAVGGALPGDDFYYGS